MRIFENNSIWQFWWLITVWLMKVISLQYSSWYDSRSWNVSREYAYKAFVVLWNWKKWNGTIIVIFYAILHFSDDVVNNFCQYYLGLWIVKACGMLSCTYRHCCISVWTFFCIDTDCISKCITPIERTVPLKPILHAQSIIMSKTLSLPRCSEKKVKTHLKMLIFVQREKTKKEYFRNS